MQSTHCERTPTRLSPAPWLLPICPHRSVSGSNERNCIPCTSLILPMNHPTRFCLNRNADLCARNSPVTGEFLAQRATNAENVSIWWLHHVAVDSHDWFTHILQVYLTGTGAIVRLPRCQWSNRTSVTPKDMFKICRWLTTTKREPCAYFLRFTVWMGKIVIGVPSK